MSELLAVTAMSMGNDMDRLTTIGHNLANATTAGYKRDIFVHHLLALNGAAEDVSPASLQSANTAKLVPYLAQRTDLQTGSFKYSGNPLDMAIEGSSLFEVTGADGTFYTRQGTFTLDAGGRVVTPSGYVVQGLGGEIRLTTHEPFIDKEGNVWEAGNVVGQLKLVSPSPNTVLTKAGNGLLHADVPLAPTGTKSGSIRQGYVESSNVVLMDEMVKMIEVMRHFEFSQRLIKGYDEAVGDAITSIAHF